MVQEAISSQKNCPMESKIKLEIEKLSSYSFIIPSFISVLVIHMGTHKLPQLNIAADTALRQKAIFLQTAQAVGPKQSR